MFFKTKDLMTVGNIGGGVATILVAMEAMALPSDAPRDQVASSVSARSDWGSNQRPRANGFSSM